jgi:hypothetical protein
LGLWIRDERDPVNDLPFIENTLWHLSMGVLRREHAWAVS